MFILGIARKHTADLNRVRTPSEDCHAVPALLSVPNDSITGVSNGRFRKLVLGRFQFLKAHDIRCGLTQPAQQIRQARVDAVDVVGDDSHFEATQVARAFSISVRTCASLRPVRAGTWKE